MKLTIKREIVSEYIDMIKEAHMLVEAAFGSKGSMPLELSDLKETGVICEFKAYSVEVTETDWVVNVKDEFVVDLLRLYRRAFPIFAPVVGSAVGAFKMMGAYVSDFAAKWADPVAEQGSLTIFQPASPKLNTYDIDAVDDYGDIKIIQIQAAPDVNEDSLFTLRHVRSSYVEAIQLSVSEFGNFVIGNDAIVSDSHGNVFARDKRKKYIVRKVSDEKGRSSVTEIVLQPKHVAQILSILGELSEAETEQLKAEQQGYEEAIA